MIPTEISKLAGRVRRKCIEIASLPMGCHLGGSLSVVDIIAVLFSQFYEPLRGDEIILSKGHAAAALYATLYECGLIEDDPALSYGKKGSHFTGHPNTSIDHVGFATGSLGHGPALGLGWSLGLNLSGLAGTTYVILGDGELQEGSCWEAFQVAVAKKIANLVFILDYNGAQNDGWVDDVSPLGNIELKTRSFGLSCVVADGHDYADLAQALRTERTSTPLFIIAHTTKGKGVKSLEGNTKSHYVKIDENLAKKWCSEILS